jgi:hypothetical protein
MNEKSNYRFITPELAPAQKISPSLCKNKSCIESPSTPLYRCDGCAKQLIHINCFAQHLKQRSYWNFVFCSVACVDAGPLILLSELKRTCRLKEYLRSKELHVVDDDKLSPMTKRLLMLQSPRLNSCQRVHNTAMTSP